tara:strand:- start:2121 stop:2666 length:546 start_codon:yes stop_codon:yes gene_type:complete
MSSKFYKSPVPLKLVPTQDSLSFNKMAKDETGLPLHPHPGSFAFKRKFHIHEGVDLYCDDGTPIFAMEDGRVVAIIPFTGEKGGTPWWNNTDAVLIEGESGVILYGEITPLDDLKIGGHIEAGQIIGHVTQVLKKDKGRPMSMLHLEFHKHGTRQAQEWRVDGKKPKTLLDPTPLLKKVKP